MTYPRDPDKRRELLRKCADLMGTNVALGRALGHLDGSHVGQMLRGDKPITEKTLDSLSEIRTLRPVFA